MLFHFPEIQTPRLLLREINPGIARILLEEYPEEEASRLLGCRTQADWAFFSQRYRSFETHNQRLSYRNWLLIEAGRGELIGDCGFHTWWLRSRQAELGYGIWNMAFRRKGLMSEAMPEVIRIGFSEMELLRIEAFAAPDNQASIRLLRKFGFKTRARLPGRSSAESQEAPDTLAFSLNSRDFEAALLGQAG